MCMTPERKDFLKYALGAILVFSIAYGVYEYGQSIDDAYSSRTFTVEGKAKVTVANDKAHFNVTVTTEGGIDQVLAQDENTKKMNAVIAYVKSKEVADENMKTEEYALNPRYSTPVCLTGRCEEPVLLGYTVTQNLSVKAVDTKVAGEIVAGVVTQGATAVSQVQFEAEGGDDATRVARVEALQDAETQAKVLAKAGHFRLGKIVTFYEQGQVMEPYPLAGMTQDALGGMEKSAVRANPALAPGSDDKEVRVTVTYEIE
jgi:uncharacterized protein YggE